MTEKTEGTAGTGNAQPVADLAASLSEELLKSIESINKAAIEASHMFVDTMEKALPIGEKGSSRHKTIIGAAVDLADRLVTQQHEFVRSVLRSAEQAAQRPGDEQQSTGAPSEST
jgi:hypothetical protein